MPSMSRGGCIWKAPGSTCSSRTSGRSRCWPRSPSRGPPGCSVTGCNDMSESPLMRAVRCVGAAVLLLNACTMGPDFVRPTPQAPPSWSDHALEPATRPPLPAAPDLTVDRRAGRVTPAPAELSAWWRGFADPQLDSLIDRALSANLDLRAAMLRVD